MRQKLDTIYVWFVEFIQLGRNCGELEITECDPFRREPNPT